MQIYLTNLGKYSEGELVGEWLELPATEDEIQATLERIGINDHYEAYFITDYEGFPFKVHEYANLTTLNEQADELSILDEQDLMIIEAYMNEVSDDFYEALDEVRDAIYITDCASYYDYGYHLIDEGYYEVDENNPLANYIDYERLGRDCAYDVTLIFLDNGDAVQWYL